MMKLARPLLAATALTAAAILPATAADISYDPPVIDYEPPVVVQPHNDAFGGWYIRGDAAYRWSKFRGGEYTLYGPAAGDLGTFDFGKLKGSYSIGGGVGYQVTRHLRTDVTIDWMGKSSFRGQTTGECGTPPTPCSSVDTSSYSAWLLLANAYVDLGTWKKITPYIGAGIGGAHVKWGELRNQIPPIDDRHRGGKGWRFAYSLMAGASYCITKNWHADVGYRFTHIHGGKMFHYVDSSGGGTGAGPGWDKGIFTHEARAGLRYQFGGADKGCGEEQIVYIPPEPYEPPVYK